MSLLKYHMSRTLPGLLTVLLLSAWPNTQAIAQPTAEAGPSQVATNGQVVTLDGSSSTGSGALNYQWAQTAGPNVLLDNNQIIHPSFVAPSVGVDTDLIFELIVTEQSTGLSSGPDPVTITVKSIDSPVAEAGSNQHVRANAPVLLDGSNSTDPNGNITNYKWTRLPTIQAADTLCNGPNPTCEVNALGRAEEMFELKVTDNQGLSATDTMSIFYKSPGVCGNDIVEPNEVCDSNAESCLTVDNHPGNKQCNDQCDDFGTCVSTESCGDGVINGTEICDQNTQPCTASGGYAGTMNCNNQCTGFGVCVSTQSCGDAIVNGSEVCDKNTQSCTASGGYAGTKICNNQCNGFNACISTQSCGDGAVNGTEVCDANTQPCTTASGYAGTMSCNGQCSGFGSCTTNLSCGDTICSAPPETSTNCSQDCNPPFSVILEAENMPTKTTGGTVTGGWNIWANGYVENTVQFPVTGIYKFDIIARGSIAANVWPNMELRIDQSTKASFTVNANGWATYTANINVTSGSRKVAIAFTNDFKTSTEDRNLYVDKVTITK